MQRVYRQYQTKRTQQFIGNTFNGYQIIKELGEGSFSKVYSCSKNGEIYAIKVVKKDIERNDPKVYELFIEEVRLLQIIQNENIIKKIDFFAEGLHFFLVLEYCNEGNLEQLLEEQERQFLKPFSEEKVTIYFKQLINAFRGLHEQNIVHRDVKTANIFVHNGQLKLGDLGFAKKLIHKNQMMDSLLGTPLTMAPEVINEETYGIEADIFSLGVVIFNLVTGYLPFKGMSLGQIYVSQKKQDLLVRMLKFNRQQRISWADLFDHEFFVNNKKFDPFNKNLLQIPAQNLESLHISQEMEGIILQQSIFIDKNKLFYKSKDNMKSIDIALQQNQKQMQVIEENNNDYSLIDMPEIRIIQANQILEQSIDFEEEQKDNEFQNQQQQNMLGNQNISNNSGEYVQFQKPNMSLIISQNGSIIQDVFIDTELDIQGDQNQNQIPQQMNIILNSADNLIQIKQNHKKQVVSITNLYLKVLEKIAFISNVAFELYSFDNNINKNYPLFVLVKFLFLELQQYQQSICLKQNILKIDKDQFQQFISSDLSVKLQTRFSELKKIMELNLEGCIFDIKEVQIDKKQEYINHFNNLENPSSQQFYCSILRQYFSRVKEESEQHILHGDQLFLKILLVHQLAILFCVREVICKNIQFDYSYESFCVKYQNFTVQELQNLIEETQQEFRIAKN